MPFGAPYGHFADAASTIKEAQHPRVLAWGPAGDHTLCAMVNDRTTAAVTAPVVNSVAAAVAALRRWLVVMIA